MDLPGVTEIADATAAEWRAGDAWLAGGTWLFSEPQPALSRLLDLRAFGWPSLQERPAGLEIAATCTLAEIASAALPQNWAAAPLFAGCCRALAGSFKVLATATVGGNLCWALPAAPMLTLAVALDGIATVWLPGGGERLVLMSGFATGPGQTVLQPGEILRAVDLPLAALRRRVAWRQASLTALGRSAALLAATLDADGGYHLVVTGSTIRPVSLRWPQPPSPDVQDAGITALPDGMWLDDVHGPPPWRRHMTRRLAGELLRELA